MSDPNGLSEHILILGDETKSARAMQRLLVTSGYDAVSLDSFDSARDELRAGKISLVILEPSASILSSRPLAPSDNDSGESQRKTLWANAALAFCEEVRSDSVTADVPLVVISKSHRAQDKVACLNRGAADYINRPYKRAELLSRIKAHLRSSHVEREIDQRLAQLNVLHTVSSVLASSLEPDVLLKGTLAALRSYVHADAGIVFLREADEPIVISAVDGLTLDDVASAELIEFYSRLAPLMNDKPLLLSPLPESLRRGFGAGLLNEFRGLVCARLTLKGETLGSICLFSTGNPEFPGHEGELLPTICNQLTVALENARLYTETKKSAAQLSFVYNLGNNLMTSLEMDELLSYAVFTVGKSLECNVCAVIVRNSSDPDQLASAIFSRSHEDQLDGDEWFHRERALNYLTSADWRLQPAIQLRTAERFLRDPHILLETVAPLMFDDQMLGILVCGSYASHSISSDDQKLLGAVAQQLSLAIRNTELYQRTKDTSINLALEVTRRTREAEEQKRFTEKIIDSLPVSLYVVDSDMRIVAWNRNREVGGLGINREHVLGRNVFQVLARQPRRKLEEEFVDVFRTAELVHMEQESWLDGQKKTWKISKIPMRVDNAEVTHVITVGEDITEQKKMNEAIIHAEKLASIGRLAAGVVHEINNPLATIAACSEALTTRIEDLDNIDLHQDFGEYLQIIRDEAFRCKTITNSLLEFSHQRQADKYTSDITHILDQVLQLIKHHPKLGVMRVVKEVDDSLPPVYANEGQMKQVFIALMTNAFDAMEEDGSLTIRARWNDSEPGRMVSIEFADTGCGIPAQHLQKIFDPFFTTKPLGRGTGLGLSVCYGIISEHGGRIEVDSTEGVGTTFRVLIPPHQDVPAHTQAQSFEGILEMEGAL